MISLLLPSRGRPNNVLRLYSSVLGTASRPNEVYLIVRVDDDDFDNYKGLQGMKNILLLSGPRLVLSEYWNECQKASAGPIYGHMGDDIIFRTPGWDTMVKQAFNEVEDKILFVHGDDGIHNAAFGTHGFIHQKWVDTVGYFVPPYYSSDYNDTHLNDVANMLGRRKHLPLMTEHMHFVNGKGPLDQTHLDRLERHHRDNVDALYHSNEMVQGRQNDVEKLKGIIDGAHQGEVQS